MLNNHNLAFLKSNAQSELIICLITIALIACSLETMSRNTTNDVPPAIVSYLDELVSQSLCFITSNFHVYFF